MIDAMKNVPNDSMVLISVGDIKGLIDELETNHDKLIEANKKLNDQITLNTSRCLCFKGALEAISQIVTNHQVISVEQVQKMFSNDNPVQPGNYNEEQNDEEMQDSKE